MATLVTDVNFLFGNVIKTNDVVFGLLADGNNEISIFTGINKFLTIYLHIQPFVLIGVAFKDQVVNGNHRFNARKLNTHRYFVA